MVLKFRKVTEIGLTRFSALSHAFPIMSCHKLHSTNMTQQTEYIFKKNNASNQIEANEMTYVFLYISPKTISYTKSHRFNGFVVISSRHKETHAMQKKTLNLCVTSWNC